MTYMKGILYGLQGDTALAKACIVRSVIVALSVQPPGVNKLCVCPDRFTEGGIDVPNKTTQSHPAVRPL